ncbi:TRM13, partial [Symbiodinium sp. CCMP2456]
TSSRTNTTSVRSRCCASAWTSPISTSLDFLVRHWRQIRSPVHPIFEATRCRSAEQLAAWALQSDWRSSGGRLLSSSQAVPGLPFVWAPVPNTSVVAPQTSLFDLSRNRKGSLSNP